MMFESGPQKALGPVGTGGLQMRRRLKTGHGFLAPRKPPSAPAPTGVSA